MKPKCTKSDCSNTARYYGSYGGFGKLCDQHSDYKAKQSRESRARIKAVEDSKQSNH